MIECMKLGKAIKTGIKIAKAVDKYTGGEANQVEAKRAIV